MTREELDKLLKYDALDDAEKMTGGTIHEDGFCLQIGMANFFENNAKKEAALLACDDSTSSNDLVRYQRIISEIGFRLCLEVPFRCEDRNEKLFVYWRRGILLAFDTFGGNNVNGGKFYYNWIPTDPKGAWKYTSSGGWENGVWAGDHDCREAIRHHISQLEANGELLSKWVRRPFLWLLHHGDTHGKKHGEYDYDNIMRERLAMLPHDVLSAIGPDMER